MKDDNVTGCIVKAAVQGEVTPLGAMPEHGGEFEIMCRIAQEVERKHELAHGERLTIEASDRVKIGKCGWDADYYFQINGGFRACTVNLREIKEILREGDYRCGQWLYTILQELDYELYM